MEVIIVLILAFLVYKFFKGTKSGRQSDVAVSSVLISKYGYSRSEANQIWYKHNRSVISWELDGVPYDEIANRLHQMESIGQNKNR